MPRINVDNNEIQKLFDEPSAGREKNKKTDLIITMKSHIIGHVNRGHILGMEDAVLSKSEYYSTGAICLSLHA